MSIKINTPAIKIVKSTFTRVVRLIIPSRWQPLLLQFQTTEALTRLQIRIYNANLSTAGAAEIKMHYTARRVASIGLDSLNTGTVQLRDTYVTLAVGLCVCMCDFFILFFFIFRSVFCISAVRAKRGRSSKSQRKQWWDNQVFCQPMTYWSLTLFVSSVRLILIKIAWSGSLAIRETW